MSSLNIKKHSNKYLNAFLLIIIYYFNKPNLSNIN